MTLEELRTTASELGLEVGSTENKGAIMLLIRDHADSTVLTLERFKGSKYTKIPESYGAWASEEERQNGACMHPDLKRFVVWRRNRRRSKPVTSVTPKTYDPEENAKVPPPPISETGSTNSHWTTVTDKDRPLTPKMKPRGRSTATASMGYERMDQDVPENVKEEIAQVEAKLASLKDKVEEGDAADEGANCRGAHLIGPTPDDLGMHYEHHDPGPQQLVALRTEDPEIGCDVQEHDTDGDAAEYKSCDEAADANEDVPEFNYVLSADARYDYLSKKEEAFPTYEIADSSLMERLNQRKRKLGERAERCLLGSVRDGDCYRLSADTLAEKDLVYYLNAWLRRRLGGDLLGKGNRWSSILIEAVNKPKAPRTIVEAAAHHDAYVTLVGTGGGGGLCVKRAGSTLEARDR